VIPSFATHLQGKTPEELVQETKREPPVYEVELGELVQFRDTCRGVYECSWPTLAGDLTLSMGVECTTWLGREPEWDDARDPVLPYVMLYELLPVSPPDKPDHLIIYKWKLIVKGEAEWRELAATNVFARMENA